jgi:hypothetical protein
MTDPSPAQLHADLRATDDSLRGLGVPGAPLHLLGSTLDPLSGLAAAGLGWFTPMVSFLGEGLTQLQGGDAASVMSGARDFGDAGQDIAGVANAYRESTSTQTSDWSGPAASGYREASAHHADGVAGLGQASTTVGTAITGAGRLVAQAIAQVTALITEAVARIVPILTQAVASAGETLGQSVAEAVPLSVGIAAEYAQRISTALAALVASGDDLLRHVRDGMATVHRIQQTLSAISGQSIGVEAVTQPPVGDPAATAPMSPAGGPAAPVAPQGTHSWTPPASYASATVPEAQVSGPGVAIGALPAGAAGAAPPAPRTERATDTPDEIVNAAPPIITSSEATD